MLSTFMVIILTGFAGVIFDRCTSLELEDFRRSYEYRLVTELLAGYDITVRPRINSSNVVNVEVRFSLQQIYDLDEKRQTLTISGWLTAEWNDEFLSWNPSEYGNMEKLIMDPRDIWTPKLGIGNSATRMFQDWRHFLITVRPNGDCRWQPGGNFAFTCALDMNYYPFDEQRCTMEVETWYYTADKVTLEKKLEKFGMETYLPHGEWAVTGTEVTSQDIVYTYYEDEAFPELYFSISLRRKYTFYFLYILQPCIMLSVVLIQMFLLPAKSGEKVSLGVNVLVSFSLFLIIVAERVPDTSDAVPVIAIYLMYFMLTTALSIMACTLVLRLYYRRSDCAPPPRWLEIISFDLIAPIICLTSMSKTRLTNRRVLRYNRDIEGQQRDSRVGCMKDDQIPDLDHVLDLELERDLEERTQCMTMSHDIPKPNRSTQAWIRISEVLDRFFFWTFLICILIPIVSLVGFLRFKENGR